MYKLKWTQAAEDQFDAIKEHGKKISKNRRLKGKTGSSKQEGLLKQIRKTLNLLAKNPRHPSLNTHPYSSLTNPVDPSKPVYEAYAQNRTPGAYRVSWRYGPKRDELTIPAITPHP